LKSHLTIVIIDIINIFNHTNMTTVIPINQARRHLGEIVEEAHYLGKPFLLIRGKKPMATLVGSQVFAQMIETIEKYDPGLADTLAIMSNPEIQALLEQSAQDVAAGRTVPITELLTD
jgi:PHD/YefM family antitoxin component YafN of YafNO toxin-antitoxin module